MPEVKKGALARSVWAWPLVLNALAVSGLISALLSERAGDVWAWFALGLPVGVMTWLAARR